MIRRSELERNLRCEVSNAITAKYDDWLTWMRRIMKKTHSSNASPVMGMTVLQVAGVGSRQV